MRKYILLSVAPALIMITLLTGSASASQWQHQTFCAEASAQPHNNQASSTAQKQYRLAPGDVPGVPAIKPSMSGHIPAFTAADVCAYIHAHPFEPGIDDSKITSILFIPSSEAFTLMKGEQTGLADNEMVCYVEFAHINVTLNDVPRPEGAKPPFIRTGQIVYSATTGNMLVWGGIN